MHRKMSNASRPVERWTVLPAAPGKINGDFSLRATFDATQHPNIRGSPHFRLADWHPQRFPVAR
jgi:hypothetical protein